MFANHIYHRGPVYIKLEYIKLSKKTNNPKPPRKRKKKKQPNLKTEQGICTDTSPKIWGGQADEETFHIIIQRNVN